MENFFRKTVDEVAEIEKQIWKLINAHNDEKYIKNISENLHAPKKDLECSQNISE